MDVFRIRQDAAVAQLAFSANSQRLAVLTAANVIHLWDVPNGRELLRLPASAGNRLTFLGDGNQLMLAGADGSRTIWDGTPFETNTAQ
jgi:WD40 repeat protein